MLYLPYLTSATALVLTIAIFIRYRRKGGMHLLLWAFGMFLYFVSTFCEIILSFQFSEIAIKVWYLAGAMLVAAWLGQGTVHLLIRKGKVAMTMTYLLLAISLVAVVLVMLAPLTGAQAGYDVTHPASEQYKAIMSRNGFIIALTILLNLYGTVTLVGGALYSAYLFWRKEVLPNRMFGSILIAIGGLSPAMGGSFLKAGLFDFLYLSELAGILIMFGGFLLATSGKDKKAETPAPVPVS
jgi:uncharacterized membrane protein